MFWEGSGELAEGEELCAPAQSSRSWAVDPGWDFWDVLGREQGLGKVVSGTRAEVKAERVEMKNKFGEA